jgi:hypothetical protein
VPLATFDGAVYSAVFEPVLAIDPGPEVIDQLTEVLLGPVTVALKAWLPPGTTFTPPGATLTEVPVLPVKLPITVLGPFTTRYCGVAFPPRFPENPLN